MIKNILFIALLISVSLTQDAGTHKVQVCVDSLKGTLDTLIGSLENSLNGENNQSFLDKLEAGLNDAVEITETMKQCEGINDNEIGQWFYDNKLTDEQKTCVNHWFAFGNQLNDLKNASHDQKNDALVDSLKSFNDVVNVCL